MNAARSLPSLVLVLALAPTAQAQDVQVTRDNAVQAEPDYSPFVDQHFPTRIFWGDTHLHTRNSIDAGFVGNTLGPEAAFRFARGEEVTSSSGLRAKLLRPLDFLVVADHAEYYGLATMLLNGDPALLADTVGARWYEMFRGSPEGGFNVFQEVVRSGSVENPRELIDNPSAKRSAWERYTATVERFNEPGRFTALGGFEWSSTPKGGNLHRVVIFRDGADRMNQVLPLRFMTARIPSTSGSTWPGMKPRPTGESWRFLTTGIGATA